MVGCSSQSFRTLLAGAVGVAGARIDRQARGMTVALVSELWAVQLLWASCGLPTEVFSWFGLVLAEKHSAIQTRPLSLIGNSHVTLDTRQLV